MASFVEVKTLLQAVAAVEGKLSANELEMYRSLEAKYQEPGHTSFDDKICLEVILRNIKIRTGYGLDSGARAERPIEFTKIRDATRGPTRGPNEEEDEP